MSAFILLLLVFVLAFGLVFLRQGRVSGKELFFSSLIVAFLLFLALLEAKPPGAPSALFRLLFFALVAGVIFFLARWLVSRLFGAAFPGRRSAVCPPVGRLKDLLAERLPSAEQARLAAHLELCTACQYRVEGLTAGQKSWPALARKLAPPPPPEPALRRVMDNLKGSQEPEPTRDQPVFSADLPLGFLSPPDKPAQLGRLERYEVLSEVGRGGMGVVLKAFDPSLHRVVAIKVLAPQLATSGVARKRFLREAKAAAAVTHDHIVTIHAVDEANGLPYLVMQYIAGQSLQDRIDKDGPLELGEILRIGMQTAAGLAAAHGQGIVHRDIKPANILLEEGVQRVKITDFGLARAMDDASLTQSGFVAGSPLFMAPEQARGEALDPRADLFSLGSVLYTMCTGRPPFRASSTLAVLRRVSEDAPRPIRETNPEVPDWLAAVVDKLHAKDPAERYQSAAEVVEVLGKRLAQIQNAAWVPPPLPAPASANPNAAGLPTSMTICPSCGASLHVPESMVGSVVHCEKCGKPFEVEEGSEVIKVAREMPAPLGPGFRARRKLPLKWIVIAAGCAALLFLTILLIHDIRESDRGPAPATASIAPIQIIGGPADPVWKDMLTWFPAEATLFGALDFKGFGSLTLNDVLTQSVLRLLVPGETGARMTPENLGRIRLDGVALAYYEDPKTADARGIIHLQGVALDGRKRILDFIHQTIPEVVQFEEGTGNQRRYRVSSPELPFAVSLYNDNHVFLARSLKKGAGELQHRRILEQVQPVEPNNFPPSPGTFPGMFPPSPLGSPLIGPLLTGYHPPWVKTALAEIPPDACGLFLGEIPPDWRKVLTETLELRVCPRTFVMTLRRWGAGVSVSLSFFVDKAGGEILLQEDLETWRRKVLDVLQARYPALRKEPEALALLGNTMKGLAWQANPGSGCVRTIPGPRTAAPLPYPMQNSWEFPAPTCKAVRDLLKRLSQPEGKGPKGQ